MMQRVEEKKCASCKNEKPTSEYGKDRSKNDGLNVYCKKCKAAKAAKSYEKNCKGNVEWLAKQAKKEAERWKVIKADPVLLQERRQYRKDLRKQNGSCKWSNMTERQKLIKNWRTILSQAASSRRLKWGPTYDKVFCCSSDFFLIHLESLFTDKMSWENYGSYWQIHHIVPVDFAGEDLDLLYLLFNYNNLMPLSAVENAEIGSSIEIEQLNEWHCENGLDF